MSQGSTYPYCDITTDLQLAFKDIEDFAGWDTLTGFTPIDEIISDKKIMVCFVAFGPESLISPSTFYSARGVLSGIRDVVLGTSSGVNSIILTWTDNSGIGDALATDLLAVAWYDETTGKWKFEATTVTRATEEATIPDPDLTIGDVLHAYPFFFRPDFSRISDSSYCTYTIL